MTQSFGDRLLATFARTGQLCVGIDPHPYLLAEWGLTDDAAGLVEFGRRVIGATVASAGIVKPQVAFFERHGSAGLAALETVIAEARATGLLVIADAKRGDVGTTVEAYAQAWLSPGSPLESDAMTISAYQGVGSIEAPITLAIEHAKGLFVLAATSNPESFAGQTAIIQTGARAGSTVAAGIVADVAKWNRPSVLGSIGVVIGATVSLDDFGIADSALAQTPILAPGFGHQGATFADTRTIYGEATGGVLVSASRSILAAGPAGIAEAVRVQSLELADGLAA